MTLRLGAAVAALLCAAAIGATAPGSAAARAGTASAGDAAQSGASERGQAARRRCRQKARAARRRCVRVRRCLRRAAGSHRKRLACRRRAKRLEPPEDPGTDPPSTDPGTDPPPTDPDPESPLVSPTLGRFVSVASREYSLTLSRPVVAAGSVTVELRNPGEDPHDLVISPDDDSHSPLASFGETASGGMLRKTVTLPAGRYLLWCSLEGHEALGMHAVLRAE
jgi:hypothetical protein